MRRLAVVLSGFALVVSVGACGGRGGGNEAVTNLAALVQQVGESTAETNTAHMTLVVDAAGQKIESEGDVKFGSDDVAMAFDMSLPGKSDMSAVLVDGVMYIDIGEEPEPGKPWIRIDPTADDEASKTLGGMIEGIREDADPRASLERLRNAGSITSEEDVELNGEQTTHYTILVDFEKLAAEEDDPELEKTLDTLGIEEFPVGVWTNEDGLPVRMRMNLPMADPDTGDSIEATIQGDYTKWGEPVEIVAPPADQVVELPG